MLSFTNTIVNIKDKGGFFVPHQRKTISYKTKKCTITNLTGRQILMPIKRITTAENNTIMKKPFLIEQHAPQLLQTKTSHLLQRVLYFSANDFR